MFRPQALAHQQNRLAGAVLATRLPRQGLWVGLACALALAGLALLGLGQYTRKAHVQGYLAPSAGLIKLYTPQAGTVVRAAVREGQAVRRGELLLELSSERTTAGGGEAQAAQLRELALRRDSLQREAAKQAEIDTLAATALTQRVSGLAQQQAHTHTQLALQQQRVASAERTLARQQQLAAAQYISEVAVQQQQDELTAQRAQLEALKRSAAALDGELAGARTELAASGLKRANNHSAIGRQVSELGQQLTEADTRRRVLLTAPADGVVTTLMVEPGQLAAPGAPLLSLLPAGATLQAQLLVPTRAAGFIRPGQAVALRYQAFPYQRFGHQAGVVAEVGRAVIQPGESALPLAPQEPVYRVTVRLARQDVPAYGEPMALRAGMLLDADVAVDRRRLVHWLLEPLLSVTGRL